MDFNADWQRYSERSHFFRRNIVKVLISHYLKF
uniref:Uncharacterized protein n=1 Tax=Arundo donax TaxID=35708 RepID=A0A0A9FNN6_ARUDO